MKQTESNKMALISESKGNYRSENHVQWHWYIEVECIIVQYAGHEKHCHQNDVAAVADSQRLAPAFGRENEALKCNE